MVQCLVFQGLKIRRLIKSEGVQEGFEEQVRNKTGLELNKQEAPKS